MVVKDRFQRERQSFDFETLSFKEASSSSTIKRDDGTDRRVSSTADTQSTVSSDDVVLQHHRKTGVAPSQSLVKKSMDRDPHTRTSLNSNNSGPPVRGGSFSSHHENSSEFKGTSSRNPSENLSHRSSGISIPGLGELATENLKVVGRSEEHKLLQGLYESPLVKMATIVGPSGSGKSVVAQELQDFIKRKGGVVCSGKFDVQNRADPYQAFVEAIGSFVSQVLSTKTRSKELASLLHDTIGEELDILEELVPSLTNLMQRKDQTKTQTSKGEIEARSKTGKANGNSNADAPNNLKGKETAANRSITERAARIQNVLVEFVKLASTEKFPLTMLLDDIQWSGSASLGLIEALLEDDQIDHFFLLTTCRDAYLKEENPEELESPDNDNNDNPFSSSVAGFKTASAEQPYPELIELLERYSKQSAQLKLEPLKLEAVHEMIDILLKMPDSEKTASLAQIVLQKTAGNPFFVLQFMNVLVDEGLLQFSTATFEWSWMEGEILTQNVAANVAEAVYKRLKKINPEDLFALQLVSAIGNSFELPMVQFVLDGLRDTSLEQEWEDTVWTTDLKWSFDRLVEQGILETQFGRGKYDFSHDQIQSAAFRLIPNERKKVLQLAIGRRLIEGLDSFHRDQFLFPAVELCVDGMELMTSEETKCMAFWAFLAGDTALKQGAFEAALRYLDVSIDALGDEPFLRDEELALPLFCGALEAAFTLGMNEKVDRYLDIVLSQEQIPLVTKSRAALIQIKTLATRHKFAQCNSYICTLFQELGAAKVSPKAGLLSAVIEIKKTYRMVSKYSQADFVSMELCKDPKVDMAIDMIKSGITALYLGNPPLFIILTCKGLQLCLKHGISPSTPICFTCVAILFAGIQKDYDKACELGESGLAICEKHRLKKALPQTAAQLFAFIHHFKRPMQQYVSPLRYANDVGMRVGVMEDVSLAKGMFCCMVNATGSTALPVALPEMERYMRNIQHAGHTDQWLHTVTSVQFAQKLHRPHASNTTLDGDLMKEDEMFELTRSKGEMVLLGFLNNYKVQLLVHFGDNPLEAIKHGEESAGMGTAYGMGTPFISRFVFFVGLANLRSYEKTKKRKYLRTARVMKNRLKALAKEKNPNILHFLLMLRAEMTRVLKRTKEEELALNQLNEAAVTSRRMGSMIDNAFANELRACFYLDSQCKSFDKEQACYYMRQAVKSYQEYGAETKVLYLKEKYNDLFLAYPATE